jgi:TRAP-type transport system periplasmic protein
MMPNTWRSLLIFLRTPAVSLRTAAVFLRNLRGSGDLIAQVECDERANLHGRRAVTSHVRRAACTALCFAAPLWASTAMGHGVTLKVHHDLPADSAFHTQFLVPWTQKVEAESGGRLRFQLFPALEMSGAAPDLYDQVKEGVADIVWTGVGHTPERFPAVEVFELPLPAHSAQGSSRALWEYVRLNDLSQTEFEGVRLLAVGRHDAPQLHMVSKRVRTAADLAGLKIATPVRSADSLLSALGAAPVATPPAEIAAALSTAKVDGVLLPWDALPALRLGDLVKYHAQLDARAPWLYSGVFVLAMNPATYKSLTDDLRKAIAANSGADTSAWLGRVFDAAAASARKAAADRGDPIDELPATELARWREPASVLVENWIKDLDGRGLQGRELVDSARTCLVQYDPAK